MPVSCVDVAQGTRAAAQILVEGSHVRPQACASAGRPHEQTEGPLQVLAWDPGASVKVLDQILRSTLTYPTHSNLTAGGTLLLCSCSLSGVRFEPIQRSETCITTRLILGTCTIEMFVTPSLTCVVLFIQCRTQTVHGRYHSADHTTKVQSSKITLSRLHHSRIDHHIPVSGGCDDLNGLTQLDSRSHIKCVKQ